MQQSGRSKVISLDCVSVCLSAMIGLSVHPQEINLLNGNLGTYSVLYANLRLKMKFQTILNQQVFKKVDYLLQQT